MLEATYGARWTAQFTSPHVTALALRQWERQLLAENVTPDQIRQALDALPEDTPNLPEFVALCKRQVRTGGHQLYLPSRIPVATKEKAAAGIAAIRAVLGGNR